MKWGDAIRKLLVLRFSQTPRCQIWGSAFPSGHYTSSSPEHLCKGEVKQGSWAEVTLVHWGKCSCNPPLLSSQAISTIQALEQGWKTRSCIILTHRWLLKTWKHPVENTDTNIWSPNTRPYIYTLLTETRLCIMLTLDYHPSQLTSVIPKEITKNELIGRGWWSGSPVNSTLNQHQN